MKILPAAALLVFLILAAACVNVELGNNDPAPPLPDTSQAAAPTLQNASWRDIATDVAGKVFLDARHNALFYGFDTISHPNEPAELTVRLQSLKNLKAIPNVTIAFHHLETLIQTTPTDPNGLASISWTPPKPGDYLFSAAVSQLPDDADPQWLQLEPASLLLAVRDQNTPFAVIDLDHTLVDASFFRVLLGGGQPMPLSQQITHKIAEKYTIIYLTHRPDLLGNRSKSWLKNHGYPTAPLIVSQLKQALSSSGAFKTAKLAELKKNFPNLRIGIGDKPSDAQAYVDNGMTAYLIPHYQDEPDDMLDMARELRGLRDQGRLHVVSSWEQIEAGIFQQKKYPPQDFAQWLESQAKLYYNP